MYYINKKENKTNPHFVQKFGKGHDLTIMYTIEHTKYDDELEEIYFSNLEREEFYSLDRFIKFLNIYQQLGYKNISIITSVLDDKAPSENSHNSLIEDITIEVDVLINSSYTKELETTRRTLTTINNHLTSENDMYKMFIEKYKANELFEKFKKELDNN